MDLREPPAKKRKSRFGPQPTQDQPAQSNPGVASDLVKRQQQALAVAATLAKQLGIGDGDRGPSGGDSSFSRPGDPNGMRRPGVGIGGMRRGNHMHYGGEHEAKVYIPTEKYPNINFIGLILGPQGMNQKRMQFETGCRLLVKGRGSSKHGDHNLNVCALCMSILPFSARRNPSILAPHHFNACTKCKISRMIPMSHCTYGYLQILERK